MFTANHWLCVCVFEDISCFLECLNKEFYTWLEFMKSPGRVLKSLAINLIILLVDFFAFSTSALRQYVKQYLSVYTDARCNQSKLFY